MLARLSLLTVFVVSIAVMGAVIFYFVQEWQEVERREQVVTELDRLAENAGPCAALEMLRELEGPISYSLERAIVARKPDYAREILISRSRKSIAVFLEADEQGYIDRTQCEEIALSSSLGEPHPVMALLRFTREDIDPCEEADEISVVLRGLSSHRPDLLHALMEEPERMHCFEPDVAQRVAAFVVDWLQDDPRGLDGVRILEAARFITHHAPVRAAQLGCRLEALHQSSKLGNAIGCSEDMRNRVLLRYRYLKPLPAEEGVQAVVPDADVLLLHREGNRCEVRPLEGEAQLIKVACNDLELVTDVRVAVRIETVTYGLVRADMIAGVANYDGRSKRVDRAGAEPALGSWFAYDLDGEALGTTQIVSLEELASRLNEELPSAPIRHYCRSLGAKFCYDVDWTKIVKAIEGEPTIFLSRPLDIFLERLEIPRDVETALIEQAFGHPPTRDAFYRMLRLGDTGTLALEARAGFVEVRWRRESDSRWQKESIGLGEGGGLPPSARLLAAMDLQQDGTPELLIQRATRALDQGQVRDTSDEIVLMVLEPGSSQFEVLNRLTVHEY